MKISFHFTRLLENKKFLIFIFLFFLTLAGLFLLLAKKKTLEIPLSSQSSIQSQSSGSPDQSVSQVSPISGLSCQNYRRRPMAVMLANDSVARPLSGLSEADIIFEMPVVTDSITRLMVVFVCGSPKEIGSIRSARHDFIPLAMGLDAIYAHWGGSHFALEKLNAKIMDNIDALKNPYGAFYRKSGISAPHNGFTSIVRLVNSAEKLGYKMENNFEGYQHYQTQNSELKTQNQNLKVKIGYPYPFNIEWLYNTEANSYLRWRGGTKEIDKNNDQQIEAKNIVVMYTKSRQIEGQYNDVEVEGEGKAEVYQNGTIIKGIWQKDKKDLKSKLYFFNEQNEEIKFVPGMIWVEIVQLTQEVKVI